MTAVPLPPRGEWFGDARDSARALRASWHVAPDDAPYVVLSTWRGDAYDRELFVRPGSRPSSWRSR